MKILSLDVASTTGWAWMSNGVVNSCGIIHAYPINKKGRPEKSASYGMSLLAFRSALADTMATVGRPDRVIVESPIMPRLTSFNTLKKLCSLNGIIHEFFEGENQISVSEVLPTEWKRACLGIGGADTKDHKKTTSCDVAFSNYPHLFNNNRNSVNPDVADAIHIAHWANKNLVEYKL